MQSLSKLNHADHSEADSSVSFHQRSVSSYSNEEAKEYPGIGKPLKVIEHGPNAHVNHHQVESKDHAPNLVSF